VVGHVRPQQRAGCYGRRTGAEQSSTREHERYSFLTDVTHSSTFNTHAADDGRIIQTVYFISFIIAFFPLSCYGFATKVFVRGPLHKLRD
jgi:hypothetical protein